MVNNKLSYYQCDTSFLFSGIKCQNNHKNDSCCLVTDFTQSFGSIIFYFKVHHKECVCGYDII